MIDPLTVVAGSSIILNRASLPWETSNGNVSEGPVVIDSGENYYVIYSATSTWSDDYSLGMLQINKTRDPMQISSWYKHPNPVFVKNVEEGVFGPGHASFTVSPDGSEHWMVYHAMNRTVGPRSMPHLLQSTLSFESNWLNDFRSTPKATTEQQEFRRLQ